MKKKKRQHCPVCKSTIPHECAQQHLVSVGDELQSLRHMGASKRKPKSAVSSWLQLMLQVVVTSLEGVETFVKDQV